VDKKDEARLAEFARGGELIFDNAEQLYREACILRENGAFSRALCLHQISNEECGKLEMLGGYAMTIVLGHGFDPAKMIKAFRNHEAKNNANAYFAGVTDEEKEARKRGDWAGSARAFEKLQEQLHDTFNTNKNASLYVNFDGETFSAPKDGVTVELVDEMATLNRYFLGLAENNTRLLRRVAVNELDFQSVARKFAEHAEESRDKNPSDREAAFDAFFREIFESIKSQSKK
jgi:AbiV family abortive infection protein